jgi:hypothetical protein
MVELDVAVMKIEEKIEQYQKCIDNLKYIRFVRANIA